MSSDLENETATLEVLNLESVQDWREVVGVELHVDDGTDDSFYLTGSGSCFGGI